MIELRNVSKSYRTFSGQWHKVLDNVSFNVPQGMNIGVLGRNGAGKSTLLRMICGLELPDEGEIFTNGNRVSWPLGSAAGIHGSLTGFENIKFVTRIFGRDFNEVFRFVEEFADLKEYMHMPVKTYSSGMRGRLAFGISMAIEFDTYLIDEGFSAGDARFRSKTEELFKERQQNANTILVSHNPSTVMKMCNTAAVLINSQIHIYEDIKEGIEVYKAL